MGLRKIRLKMGQYVKIRIYSEVYTDNKDSRKPSVHHFERACPEGGERSAPI